MDSNEELLQQVQVTPELSLSKVFASHWPEIEQTCLESIHIEAIPTDELRIEQSKFGHYPWLPEGFDYPSDHRGNSMFLLAQLNFEEIPKLEGYHTTGILQFYISTSDEFVFGLNFSDTGNDGHRVLYFEKTDDRYQTVFPYDFKEHDLDNIPFRQTHSLSFMMQTEYVGMGDVRGEKEIVPKIEEWLAPYSDEMSSELEREAYDKFSHSGHKIGGYAYFTQQDPREEDSMILLFQMDSDKGIMWGDAGIANFFIHPEDLKNRNFSRVMYSWDCS